MASNNSQIQPVLCYVALGSNLGDSVNYLAEALQALSDHPEFNSLNTSLFYQSKPHGPQDQPDYVNAAVSFETLLQPESLLDELQRIENENGRIREGVERWGARTLDLDLLFYGNNIINTERLTVPHPRICERAFVLFPLRDLLKDKDLKVSEAATIKECIAMLSEKDKSEIKECKIND